MTGQGVTLECSACGHRWTVLPKADGTMPTSARCPKGQGGCGKLRKLPRLSALAIVGGDVPPEVWDPPSQPRGQRLTADECPECGSVLAASPLGSARLCGPCRAFRTPPGVLAPYARGREVTRAATSQRERDDDAKRTVLAADKFLRGVRALIADPKMHPDSAAVLRWYEEEITEASRKRDGRRLAELRDEFADDAAGGEFRRVRWWQGTPAALAAAVDPGDGDDAEDYEDDPEEWAGDGEGQGDEAAAVLAASASIAAAQHAMTWAEGLAVCGWRLGEVIGGGHGEICQVIDEHGQRCRMAGMHLVPIGPLGRHVPLCPGHHDPLGGLIIETNRARGVA